MVEIFITLAAFLLAFFSMVNPIIKFRLDMSWFTMRNVFWVLAILGIISIAYNPIKQQFLPYSTLLETTNNHYGVMNNRSLNLLFDIVFWVWSIALVGLSLIIFYTLVNPVRFNARNSKKFFYGCNLIISSGIEEHIGMLTAEVSDSIPTIFDKAAQNEIGKEIKLYAWDLLELFSDEIFCKHIILHNPKTLKNIFLQVINKTDIYPVGANLITKLIELMLFERKSQLNREEKYGGVSGDLVFLEEWFLKMSNF